MRLVVRPSLASLDSGDGGLVNAKPVCDAALWDCSHKRQFADRSDFCRGKFPLKLAGIEMSSVSSLVRIILGRQRPTEIVGSIVLGVAVRMSAFVSHGRFGAMKRLAYQLVDQALLLRKPSDGKRYEGVPKAVLPGFEKAWRLPLVGAYSAKVADLVIGKFDYSRPRFNFIHRPVLTLAGG
jgi:hypothetical protein